LESDAHEEADDEPVAEPNVEDPADGSLMSNA